MIELYINLIKYLFLFTSCDDINVKYFFEHIKGHDAGYPGSPSSSDDYSEPPHDYSPHQTYNVPSDGRFHLSYICNCNIVKFLHTHCTLFLRFYAFLRYAINPR